MQNRSAIFSNRVIDQTMIDADCAFVIVQVVPAQSKRFTNTATCTQQYREHRPPVIVNWMVGNVFHKRPLLGNRQCVASSSSLPKGFLYLCQYAISWIFADDVITKCQLKRWMQQAMDAFQCVRLQALHDNQIIIKLKHIGILNIRNLSFSKSFTNMAVIHIKIIASCCFPKVCL